MATAIYPRHSVISPERPMMGAPVRGIPRCWEAELRPLTFLAGTFDRLPEGEATLALLLRCTAEGAHLQEVSAPGYERQPLDLQLHEPGRPTSNIHPVVFRFDEQPTAVIPLVGLFVRGRLVMRGGLKRVLYEPQGVDLTGPQMRVESGTLRLRFC